MPFISRTIYAAALNNVLDVEEHQAYKHAEAVTENIEGASAPVHGAAPVTRLKAGALKIACSNCKVQAASCKLRELCLPAGLSAKALEQFDMLAAEHCPMPRGETLFHIANPLDTLYAIRTDCSKTSVAIEDGATKSRTS